MIHPYGKLCMKNPKFKVGDHLIALNSNSYLKDIVIIDIWEDRYQWLRLEDYYKYIQDKETYRQKRLFYLDNQPNIEDNYMLNKVYDTPLYKVMHKSS